ncbi:pectinesterase-like [Rutidosis leptorrhynchoides]|uniref:pectinesterase-like n=1 Tax=Rutidosis leptorrhynchoides TaxID=125765 RepID=UPI003A994C0E
MPTLVLLFNIFASSLLIIITATTSLDYNRAVSSSSGNDIIRSLCSTTLYPDICYSSIISSNSYATILLSREVAIGITAKKDVIEVAINKTKDTIQDNIHNIQKLIMRIKVTNKHSKIMALDDCLQMGDATLQGLDMVIQQLRDYQYPTSNKRHAHQHLISLMSTTITNKETCLDSLSYSVDDDDDDDDTASSKELIIKGQEHAGKMCSNVLAMINNITTPPDTASQNHHHHQLNGRKNLKEEEEDEDEDEVVIWPNWLSGGDARKLLGLWGVKPNVTVSANGKGDYKTVTEAVEAAPLKSDKRYVIKITAGVYKENVEIPKHKRNIMFLGDGRGNTIITGNKSYASGITTYKTATVAVIGDRFLARDITFQNTAGPSGHQAVALLVRSDLSAFYRCGMDAYQDTLYVHSNRQFYVKCFVLGTIDFIFGDATAVFQFCDIFARLPNPNQKNMVTAQGRTDGNQNTGIVIHKCKIGATSDLKAVQTNYSTYLGRPWKKYSRTVVMQSSITDVIHPEGWYPWEKGSDFALDTLYYREYRNSGSGSNTSKRVNWKGWGVIKDKNEAKSFTVAKFIDGWGWLPSTNFPFWPGL